MHFLLSLVKSNIHHAYYFLTNILKGVITKQGLLLMKEEATCFKKRSGRIMKPKPRDCVIFVFRESIIVCEKAPQLFSSSNFSSYPQINYWVSFQVSEFAGTKRPDGPSLPLFGSSKGKSTLCPPSIFGT